MKGVLAVIALVAVAEAGFWGESVNYLPSRVSPLGSGNGYHTPATPFFESLWPKHFGQHSSESTESRYNNADWICRNPKTGDTMVLITQESVGGAPNTHQGPAHGHEHGYEHGQGHGHGHGHGHGYGPGHGHGYFDDEHGYGHGHGHWPTILPIPTLDVPTNIPTRPPPNKNHNGENTPGTEAPTTTSTAKPQVEPEQSHGGEGLIDVRIGSEKRK